MCSQPLSISTVADFIQVSRGLNDYSLLFALMRVVWSLLRNPHVHIEPYVSKISFV